MISGIIKPDNINMNSLEANIISTNIILLL